MPEQKCVQTRKDPQVILAVLPRGLTQYGRISARQNRVCPCQPMVSYADGAKQSVAFATDCFDNFSQSRHVLRSSSATMGISSRRPMSISSDSMILLSGDRMAKFSIGPSRPRPGPTLLMHVSDAAKDS